MIGEIAEATEKLYAEAPRCYVIGPALDSVLDILAELFNIWQDGTTYFSLQMNQFVAKAISMFD